MLVPGKSRKVSSRRIALGPGSRSRTRLLVRDTRVNINTASVEELEKLPDVGAKLAERIVEHRETYGKFRKPEHLILVQGISDKRFRQIQNLIKTE